MRIPWKTFVIQWDITVSLGWLSHIHRSHYRKWLFTEVWLVITVDKESSLMCSKSTKSGLTRLIGQYLLIGRFTRWKTTNKSQPGIHDNRLLPTNDDKDRQTCQLCSCSWTTSICAFYVTLCLSLEQSSWSSEWLVQSHRWHSTTTYTRWLDIDHTMWRQWIENRGSRGTNGK